MNPIEVRYSKTQLWLSWAVLVPIVVGALWVGHFYKDERLFSPTTLGVVAAIFVVAAIRIATSDGVAFRATPEALFVSHVWRRRRIDWRDVIDVKLIERTTYRSGRAVRGSETIRLSFTIANGAKEEHLDYNYGLFGLPLADGFALVERLRSMRPSLGSRQASARSGGDFLEGVPKKFGRAESTPTAPSRGATDLW